MKSSAMYLRERSTGAGDYRLEPGVWRVAGHCDLDVLLRTHGRGYPETTELTPQRPDYQLELSNVPEDGSTLISTWHGMRVHVERCMTGAWVGDHPPARKRNCRRDKPAAKEDDMSSSKRTQAPK